MENKDNTCYKKGKLIMMFPKNKRIVDKKAIARCREKGFCQICGHPGDDVHHIVSRGAGGPDHIYNLIYLCRQCHKEIHDGKLERHWIFCFVSMREGKSIDENTIYEIMRGEL
jgi:hypothetical protein